MTPLMHVLPLATAGVVWFLLHRVNRRRGWFRVGELIFWDAVILVLLFLLWLRWF